VRRSLAVLATALLLGACAGRDQPAIVGEPPARETGPAGETGGAPAELPGASCKDRGGGSDRNVPDFVKVETESSGGVERVTFRFEPRDPGATRPPSHFTHFVDELATEGEGRKVDVEGEAFLLVTFSAFGVDISGEQPEIIYKGPKEIRPGFGTMLELEELGDFEATINWGIGLSREACYRVESGPDFLTIEFPAS
jgi:hypothetical protein